MFSETPTGYDKGVVKRNEGALAVVADTAQGRVVRVPRQLCPVAMNRLRPCLDERIGDVVQEGGVRVEICNCDSFKLQAFAFEVFVDEIENSAFRFGNGTSRTKYSTRSSSASLPSPPCLLTKHASADTPSAMALGSMMIRVKIDQ